MATHRLPTAADGYGGAATAAAIPLDPGAPTTRRYRYARALLLRARKYIETGRPEPDRRLLLSQPHMFRPANLKTLSTPQQASRRESEATATLIVSDSQARDRSPEADVFKH